MGMNNEEKSIGLKDGLAAGAGLYLGWVFMRWSILFVTILGATCVMCHAVKTDPESYDRTIVRVEKATGTDIIDLKWGMRIGDKVAYKSACYIRKRPTVKASKIGVAKKGQEFIVQAFHNGKKWRQVKYKGKLGWIGCKNTK